MTAKIPEPYVRIGLAIINPYGAVWDEHIFRTADEALSFLLKEWGGKGPPGDLSRWSLMPAKLTIAVMTTEVAPDPIRMEDKP